MPRSGEVLAVKGSENGLVRGKPDADIVGEIEFGVEYLRPLADGKGEVERYSNHSPGYKGGRCE